MIKKENQEENNLGSKSKKPGMRLLPKKHVIFAGSGPQMGLSAF